MITLKAPCPTLLGERAIGLPIRKVVMQYKRDWKAGRVYGVLDVP